MGNFNKFSHSISGYTPETWTNTNSKRSKHGFIFNCLISELLFNGSLNIFHVYENVFEKVTKIFFPNRDIILFSFSINLNINYLTKIWALIF